MNKVTEEALTNMIRRIEVLEQKVGLGEKPKQKPNYQKPGYTSGIATPGQLNYIKILGGESWEEMTKSEAGKEIDRLVREKDTKKQKVPQNQPIPQTEATEDPFEEIQTQKPLTKEQIEEIGEESLL